MVLGKYSVGIGDRFGREGVAQLSAFQKAEALGVEITPVWNKSNREHQIIGTAPESVRAEADQAVQALDWRGAYYVDADHIGLKTVDGFIAASDFFTLDVADWIGRPAAAPALDAFVGKYEEYARRLKLPGLSCAANLEPQQLRAIAQKYLAAVEEAARIYQHIERRKGRGTFITEVSMDETDRPQTPLELLFILAALADAGVPLQTIAPRFSGRFNKGVDYAGDLACFAREFNDDLAVIAFAVAEFGLPGDLKLSIHSGSDKFSIYEPIRKALLKHDAGLHLKTAGTTWLEEVIGLASAGGSGLEIVKEIYAAVFGRFDELCGPYAAVIDIDRAKLPAPAEVNGWSRERYVETLRHDRSCAAYSPDFRQMLHVGYKVAAELGARYTAALQQHREAVAANVTENIFARHLMPLFIGA